MAQVELLSPAGSWDALKAAVSSGADAVYFGAAAYNARIRAKNFTSDDLANVSSFCHEHGVKAYLTANTSVKNAELAGFFEMIDDAYAAYIDAVILQDAAFIRPVKDAYSDLGVHVSTQAAIFNSHYKPALEGADRVILPRELSIKQVRDFREKTGLETEVFVHGALCFSVSGQCLMSSFLGGRSGNRGLCAQPCRKKYNNEYLLSTRDLCTVERLPEIVSSGVSSLKIEGRLRDPEYVAAATSLYRRALDSIAAGRFRVDADALFDARLAFSRDYTSGMLFKNAGVVSPEAAGKRGVYLGRMGAAGNMLLQSSLEVGDGVCVVTGRGVHGDRVRKIFVKGREAGSASAGQGVRLQINAKEGDEIYLTSAVPRRKPHVLKERRPVRLPERKRGRIIWRIEDASLSDTRILSKVYSLEDAKAADEAGADRTYYNLFARDYDPTLVYLCPYIPRCLSDSNVEKAVAKIKETRPKSVLSGDLGAALAVRKYAEDVFLDISANAYNDIDVGFYNGFGIVPLISPELSINEISAFKDKRFAVYSHGRVPLMSTKYLLSAERLADEMGYVFPVRTELDYSQVLNSVPLGLFDRIKTLRKAGVSNFLIDSDRDAGGTVRMYRDILSGRHIKKPVEYTLGNYREGVL